MVKELCTAEGPAGDRREQTDFRTERLAGPVRAFGDAAAFRRACTSAAGPHAWKRSQAHGRIGVQVSHLAHGLSRLRAARLALE
jgi:hypothetical protein